MLSAIIIEHRTEIVDRFVAALRRSDAPPEALTKSELANALPGFLIDLANGLASQDASPTSKQGRDARTHGAQRWRLGFDVEVVVREYGLLRRCILEVAESVGFQVDAGERDRLSTAIEHAIAEAIAEYTRRREHELALERGRVRLLAEAGSRLLATHDVHRTLEEVCALCVPSISDCCVAYATEGPSSGLVALQHIQSERVDPIRAVIERAPWGNLETALVPRASELIDDESPVTRALRGFGAHSWIVVPLKIQKRQLGALVFFTLDSGRCYDEADLFLAEELGRRAAIVIDNRLLFDAAKQALGSAENEARAKDDFLATVSHELRTPLNAMLGWARLLRDGNHSADRIDKGLEVIERNAQMQKQLVDDLIDLSGIIGGKVKINVGSVDVAGTMDMVVETLMPAADAKKIEVTVTRDAHPTIVRGDPDRLQQVFWNLLGNAIKFTPKGGKIAVSVRRVESNVEITVVDSGRGIALEYLPHVFDRFSQAESGTNRTQGGLGLGLTIVRQLVELHGGSVQARSQGLAKGATFSVLIPVSPLTSTALERPRARATTTPSQTLEKSKTLLGRRILIVDDEADARDLLVTVLERSGAETATASNAADALRTIRELRPDLLISDVGMPGEDGYELIRQLRQHDVAEGARIPAIALTAYTRAEDRTRALVAGFDLHLEKPVSACELVDAIVQLAGPIQPSDSV